MGVNNRQVLYIGGMGRSGSTLFERALGQIPGVVGAGELVFLWERGIANNERCGCGEPFRTCTFWSEVGSHAFGGWGQVDVSRILALASRVDDVKFVPRMMFRVRNEKFRADLEEYLEYYVRLYDGIRAASGCDVVVDSSKLTSLAYALSHEPRVQLSMAHMVRDARAVAYSWTKVVKRPEIADAESFMPRYSPGYMAVLYDGHHALLEGLRFRGVPSVRVRYEDFVADPAASIQRVTSMLGLGVDAGNLVHQSAGSPTLQLPASHTVSGNPSRFTTGDIVVRRDDSWRAKMPRRQQLLVGALAAPMQATYGYLPRRGLSDG